VEAVSGQLNWCQVGLQIKSRYLSSQSSITSALQNFESNRCRSHASIDKKHFLFGANPTHAAFNPAFLQHESKRTQVSQQGLRKLMQLSLIQFLFDVMLAHIHP
jgi:hypothetical protein